jgi:hypothetical protein
MIQGLQNSPSFLIDHFAKALPSRPKKYTAIAEELDPALQRYKKGIDYLSCRLEGPYEKGELHGCVSFIGPFHAMILRENLSGAIVSKGTFDALGNYPKDVFNEHFWKNSETLPKYSLEKTYGQLMDSGNARYTTGFNIIMAQEEPTAIAQMKGRDIWAGLVKEGAGTPQGASWSPFLTSLASGKIINFEEIIMYMDDGLIYADSKEELERNIQSLTKGFKSIGVELQPTKCGYIKENGEWKTDLKILGTSYYHSLDWLFSKTRSGTSKPFPRPDYEQIKQYEKENLIIDKEYENKLNQLEEWCNQEAQGSRTKLLNWIKIQINRIRERGEFSPQPSHIYGKRHNLTGVFLAQTWSKGEERTKSLIKNGILKKVTKLEESKRSSFLKRMHPHYVATPETLSQISTKMVKELLIWQGNKKRTASKKSKQKGP